MFLAGKVALLLCAPHFITTLVFSLCVFLIFAPCFLWILLFHTFVPPHKHAQTHTHFFSGNLNAIILLQQSYLYVEQMWQNRSWIEVLIHWVRTELSCFSQQLVHGYQITGGTVMEHNVLSESNLPFRAFITGWRQMSTLTYKHLSSTGPLNWYKNLWRNAKGQILANV